MILFQVRDLLHKTCGEPHIAPDLETAAIQIGGLISESAAFSKKPEMFLIEELGLWASETGLSLDVTYPMKKISGKEALALYEEQLKKLPADEFVADGIETEDDDGR